MYDYKGISSLIGGTIIMLVIGSLYTFGTLSVYISSYLHYYSDPSIKTVTIAPILPFLLSSMNLGILIGPEISKRINIRIIIIVSILLYSLTLYGLSLTRGLTGYLILYGGFSGLFIGIPYVLPIQNAYKYFQNRKGLCSGICIMGLGFGSLIFNQIILSVMNPNDLKVNSDGYFPLEVINNLPRTFRILSILYFSMALIATILIIPKENNPIQNIKNSIQKNLLSQQTQKQQPKNQCRSLKQAFTNKIFYVLFLLTTLTPNFGYFIAFNYKQYGLTGIQDDSFLTLVGSLGGIANGSSRFFWGYILDKISFKKIMLTVNLGLLILALSINEIVTIKPLYLIYVVLCYFFYGGLFSIFPAKTYLVFGSKEGGRIYGYVFIGFSIAAVIQFLLHYFLVRQYGVSGFKYSFYILAFLQILGLGVSLIVNYQVNWNQKKQNILQN